MLMLGSWKVNIQVGKYPQKVASAISNITILGAEYTPIVYLGSQEVNGVNHAVLAEQLVTTGKDSKNAVVMIFNEKPNDTVATLVNIERVVESGGSLGGINVDVKTDIDEDAKKAFEEAMQGYVGMKVEPFALLGTQVTKGTNYIFAVKMSPVVAEPTDNVGILVVNNLTKTLTFKELLGDKTDVTSLGYAFTW